jgi:hypothetical protein
MATIQVALIDRILRVLRILDFDSTADPTQSANVLTCLNGMIDEWNQPTPILYEEQEETALTLTGATSYTIGPSGVLNTVRPERIISAFYALSGSDYRPLKIITKTQWDWIQGKLDAGFPMNLWYDMAYPLGAIHLWPNPSTGSIKISTLKQLTSFATVNDTLALPPGYSEALLWNGAVRYSPEGGVLSNEARQLAVSSLMTVRRKNKKLIEVFIDTPGQRLRNSNLING